LTELASKIILTSISMKKTLSQSEKTSKDMLKSELKFILPKVMLDASNQPLLLKVNNVLTKTHGQLKLLKLKHLFTKKFCKSALRSPTANLLSLGVLPISIHPFHHLKKLFLLTNSSIRNLLTTQSSQFCNLTLKRKSNSYSDIFT
jgi:hypothetical protein